MTYANFIAGIDLVSLSADPYPTYSILREVAPVAWIPAVKMYWVTRYEDVRAILLDTGNFETGTASSLIQDIFGENMLTSEGFTHRRYRDAKLNIAFMPASLRDSVQAGIKRRIQQLMSAAFKGGKVELRAALASRLPILTMIDIFGLSDDWESVLRKWYDAFEAALSNHGDDAVIRDRAKSCVHEFHARFQSAIEDCRTRPCPGLLHEFLNRPKDVRLSDDEIRRNALILMFGGISTVEALILNGMWGLLKHPMALSQVLEDRSLLDSVFHETVRWMSPVQSATRHAIRDVVVSGVTIPAGATVNCMLGSANRDGSVFDAPDEFDIMRKNAREHLGFAIGPHHCLGRHLAQMQMRLALEVILTSTRNLRLVSFAEGPRGHEFRQPPQLNVKWDQ